MRDNALKRPFQIITSVCDTRVTAGSYGLKRPFQITTIVCDTRVTVGSFNKHCKIDNAASRMIRPSLKKVILLEEKLVQMVEIVISLA